MTMHERRDQRKREAALGAWDLESHRSKDQDYDITKHMEKGAASFKHTVMHTKDASIQSPLKGDWH